jgi:hypothetical protein
MAKYEDNANIRQATTIAAELVQRSKRKNCCFISRGTFSKGKRPPA